MTRRDYSQVWTDYWGQVWPVVQSSRRLKFKYPAHAALRAHVFHRDGYQCVRCRVSAAHIPEGYDGADALPTTAARGGYPVLLVADHVLTLKAGGRSVVENLQTLCETCNRRKQKEDRAAIADLNRGGNGSN